MMQKILSYMRRAVDDYNMIEEGEKIAIGVSGGKDSLALLTAMATLRRFYPKKFDIVAITLDLGYDTMDFSPIKKLCEEINVEYHIIKTHIKEVVFDIRKEENGQRMVACITQSGERVHPNHNIQNRYLSGEYKGIPKEVRFSLNALLSELKNSN